MEYVPACNRNSHLLLRHDDAFLLRPPLREVAHNAKILRRGLGDCGGIREFIFFSRLCTQVPVPLTRLKLASMGFLPVSFRLVYAPVGVHQWDITVRELQNTLFVSKHGVVPVIGVC